MGHILDEHLVSVSTVALARWYEACQKKRKEADMIQQRCDLKAKLILDCSLYVEVCPFEVWGKDETICLWADTSRHTNSNTFEALIWEAVTHCLHVGVLDPAKLT